eukprot:jgi/Orpsp1_1/1178187/evm.model.c7180000064364.1
MNMHDIFSKVSNTTQGITSSLKREAQNLYAQYQQNQNQGQNMNMNNNMNSNMGNMNGNNSNINNNNNNNNMGMGENPFLQVTAPPGTLPPGTYVTVGQYQVIIERHLAEGGFAHVYVVQSQSGKKAVLKQIIVPDQEQVLTFQKEISIMRSVSGNENIVQFFDSQIRARTKSEGDGYEVLILMEYCSEGHIVDLMNSRLKVRLTENEIINIFYSVCKAVAHLHYQNPPIIHRDIKVENVLITSDGKYKLCDFGSATTEIIPPNKSLNIQEIRSLEEDIQKYTTIQYRPPEMCDLYQRRGLNEKVDTWTTPFEDGNTLAILNCSYSKPQTPTYSNHIHHLLDIMLVVEPSMRANIYDILSYLSSVLGVPCPISNKYTFSDSSNANNNSPFFAASATNSVLTSVKQPVATVPIVQNPNPTPMRRGRPNQKERKPNNNVASNANAAVASKIATLSYNSQQMKQSTNDSFKTPITINSSNANHLSPNSLSSSYGGNTSKIPSNPSGGASGGSFFTKYSQETKEQRNSRDTYKSSSALPVIKNNISGSNNKNEADQSMLDNIFGKSTNDVFNDVSKNGNGDINVFDDDWVVDNAKNSFDKQSEKRALNDNFNNTNDFFNNSNDIFNNDSNNGSKKIPRPPSFTQLAEKSADTNNPLSKGSSSFSKYKSDPFILSSTNPFADMDNDDEDEQNQPLFETNFNDNFDNNFDDSDIEENTISIYKNENNDDKINAFKIRNESKNYLTSPSRQKSPQKNGFADSPFSNNDTNDNNYGYMKFEDDDDVFSPKSPSIKITGSTPIPSTINVNKFENSFDPSFNTVNFGNERNTGNTQFDNTSNIFDNNNSYNSNNNKRNSLKENKDKSETDKISNHSLQGANKLNQSFQRLALSLKKKQKQKKHILLDNNSSEDDDDDNGFEDESDFISPYSQINDEEDDNIFVNNTNLSPPPKSGHTRYPSDPQSNVVKLHQKSRSMGRFPDTQIHKSSNIENNKESNYSYDSKSKPPPTATSPSGINPSTITMSPLNKTTPLNTQPKKKKVPPPIPPKPKELKKYVIPNAYPGKPSRQSSISPKTKLENNHISNNNEHDNPLKVTNSKLADLSNLKITPINQSATSLSSTNLSDNHRHSGYYFDNEEAFQQLDQTTNITDEMENFPDDNDSDQDIFNNGKVKRRSKFKYLH